jgi:hypothetical protein
MPQIRPTVTPMYQESTIEIDIIPGFIKNISDALVIYPHMNLVKLNNQVHYLGWCSKRLDHTTFESAVACLENNCTNPFEDASDQLLEKYFYSA